MLFGVAWGKFLRDTWFDSFMQLRLVATDLEPLREDPDIEPEPSGEDLLS
jgi:hypothetical protein